MAKYNCKTCGAELFFNPKTGKLECEYCGSSFLPSEYEETPEVTPEEAAPQEPVKDPETGEDYVTDETSTDDSTGDLVIYKCPHCGAEVITSKQTAATTCVYCNRAITLEGNLTGSFKPDYVLPFKKEKKDVEAAYVELCNKSFLTPRLFRQKSTIEKIKGMYIPFWLYTFDGEADVSVIGKKVRTWRTGDVEYTEVSRYRVEERASGTSKWNFWKLMKYAFDGIIAFSNKPLIMSSVAGLFITGLSLLYLIIIVVKTIIWGDPVAGFPTLACLILMLSGIQLLGIGILGQYMAKNYTETKGRPVYIVKEEMDSAGGAHGADEDMRKQDL